jgi:hypothetical protein
MSKKIFLLVWLIPTITFGQQQIERNSKKYEPLIPVRRQELLKNMDVIANMRYGFNNYFTNGNYKQSQFNNDQFRLEFRGKVHDKVSFRFRDRYTRATNPGDLDNISRSVDMAFIQVDLAERHLIRAGKMCADWGGVEFDLNPIEIYEYNDIVEYADNFLSGFQYTYKAGADKKHEFTAQILNARTQSFAVLYPSLTDSVAPSGFPGAYVLNWRGNLFNGKWQTIWSYSIFNEARKNNMLYLALGNTFNLSDQIQLNYDFKWSDESLDRKTIVSDMAKQMVGDQLLAYQDSRYIEHWVQLNYRFQPKWNLNLMAFTSAAFWANAPGQSGYTKLRDSYGIVPTLEFYPFDDLNLRFFANYVGRFYQYSGYAKQNNMQNGIDQTARFNIGFMTPLLIL